MVSCPPGVLYPCRTAWHFIFDGCKVNLMHAFGTFHEHQSLLLCSGELSFFVFVCAPHQDDPWGAITIGWLKHWKHRNSIHNHLLQVFMYLVQGLHHSPVEMQKNASHSGNYAEKCKHHPPVMYQNVCSSTGTLNHWNKNVTAVYFMCSIFYFSLKTSHLTHLIMMAPLVVISWDHIWGSNMVRHVVKLEVHIPSGIRPLENLFEFLIVQQSSMDVEKYVQWSHFLPVELTQPAPPFLFVHTQYTK